MRSLALVLLATFVPAQSTGRVELLRDRWGVPHVFATTDEGAFYGLGYASAQDRGFQMYYFLRIVQGRLAEVVGDVKHDRRRETATFSDRKMRMFGFYRVAGKVAKNLDAETRALLQAYCDGVNYWFAEHVNDRHYLFAKLGLRIEPWKPRDCIASWWHMAQFFATDGTRDLIARRHASGEGRRGRRFARPNPVPGDDTTSVVKRHHVEQKWVDQLHAFLRRYGHTKKQEPAEGDKGKKFSHAWVVGGAKSTTGSTLLVSDPQTPVTNPALFLEFHVHGKTFNARGIGVPGSPIVLIGFTENVAWGVTALGADQADLFQLETDADHPDQYFFDGKWRRMRVWTETIAVRGGAPRKIRLRETELGPVITPFAFAQPGDGEIVAKRIPICETDRETIQGAIAMLRARDTREFGKALSGWRFPSVNMLFGDKAGSIGYWTLAAMPLRSPLAEKGGRLAHRGNSSRWDWSAMVPHELMPHVFDPKEGYLFSGNHRPVSSFYPIYLGTMTGSHGDTIRSWRLRERLAAKKKFSPKDVLDIHYDTVNPARREIVRLGMHIVGPLKRRLSFAATMCLAELESWFKRGCPSDLRIPGAALAMEIPMMFRISNTVLAGKYGGGLSGLSRFLKTFKQRLDADSKTPVPDDVVDYVDRVLGEALASTQRKYGADSKQWSKRARAAVRGRNLGYYRSLDGYPALDSTRALAYADLYCVDGSTIHSQAAQSYTQFVNMADVDSSQSILPPGQSEEPKSPYRTSTRDLWGKGKLHPAPLSRKAVEKITKERTVLLRR